MSGQLKCSFEESVTLPERTVPITNIGKTGPTIQDTPVNEEDGWSKERLQEEMSKVKTTRLGLFVLTTCLFAGAVLIGLADFFREFPTGAFDYSAEWVFVLLILPLVIAGFLSLRAFQGRERRYHRLRSRL